MIFATGGQERALLYSMKRRTGASGGAAVDEIAHCYREFADVFESARVKPSAV